MIIGLTKSHYAELFAKQLKALSPSYTDIQSINKVSLEKRNPNLPYRRLVLVGVNTQEDANKIIQLQGGIVHFARDPSSTIAIPTPLQGTRHFICDTQEGEHYEADDVIFALRYTKFNK